MPDHMVYMVQIHPAYTILQRPQQMSYIELLVWPPIVKAEINVFKKVLGKYLYKKKDIILVLFIE